MFCLFLVHTNTTHVVFLVTGNVTRNLSSPNLRPAVSCPALGVPHYSTQVAMRETSSTEESLYLSKCLAGRCVYKLIKDKLVVILLVIVRHIATAIGPRVTQNTRPLRPPAGLPFDRSAMLLRRCSGFSALHLARARVSITVMRHFGL